MADSKESDAEEANFHSDKSAARVRNLSNVRGSNVSVAEGRMGSVGKRSSGSGMEGGYSSPARGSNTTAARGSNASPARGSIVSPGRGSSAPATGSSSAAAMRSSGGSAMESSSGSAIRSSGASAIRSSAASAMRSSSGSAVAIERNSPRTSQTAPSLRFSQDTSEDRSKSKMSIPKRASDTAPSTEAVKTQKSSVEEFSSEAALAANQEAAETDGASGGDFEQEEDEEYEEDDANLLKPFEEEGIEEEGDEEDAEVEVDDSASSIQLGMGKRVRQYPFKFKKGDNGNILTVHHTVQEQKMVLRIRMSACAFNANCTHLVAMDRRGNVFVFDLSSKRYWQLMEIVLKPSIIVPWVKRNNQFLVGTKLGQLLRLDLEQCGVTKSLEVSSEPVKAITFPGQPLQPQHMVLVQAGSEAILINLEKFTATHRLSFDQVNVALKFAFYLPRSELIFTCFTNDAVYVWSCVTLNSVRVTHPISARDRKLRLQGDAAIAATLTLSGDHEQHKNEFTVDCVVEDYSDGRIIGHCCHPDGSLLCLSTVDKYLLFFNIYTFDLQHICRLHDFVVRECAFMPQTKELMLFVLTTAGQVLLLNCLNKDAKLRLQAAHAQHLNISDDGKLLAVINLTGELDIWSPCRLYNSMKAQEKCMNMLKAAFKQSKPLGVGATATAAAAAAAEAEQQCLDHDLRKLLKRDRLLGILREYRWFPCKYRLLIWCTLLQLPYNRREFQQLLKLGVPATVKQRANTIKIRDQTMKRALVRVWSCLAHWCKVFAHSDFLPALIFPFVKLFPRNALVAFELCASLLMNHFQLWFEFHPLEPSNYLGMCENLLQCNSPELCTFYAGMLIGPEHYAWPLLSTAFSEVFLEEQWLCLWDNILAWPPYFAVFVAVAYNLLQREVIVRLPDKQTVLAFFHEQNPVDVCQVITKAFCLMQKCPATLHPKRYMKEFQRIPKGVYPKFLNYPRERLQRQEEDVAKMQQEQRAIDARIRQLELEEMQMMERLERGMRNEEHTKQMKKMEQLYRDTIKREEDRLACQRKMLLLYQKEIRSRKAEVVAKLQESERRQKALQMEKELDVLMHNIERERIRTDTSMLIAEDEIRNQNMELYTQCLGETRDSSLHSKYADQLKRFCEERSLLRQQLSEVSAPTSHESHAAPVVRQQSSLDNIEEKLNEIQKEFCKIVTKQ